MLDSIVTYPGITAIKAARFTASRGALPGRGTLVILPQDGFEPGGAQPLTWQSSIGTVVIPGCVLDTAHLVRLEHGPRTDWRWHITVYDRRYYWWNYSIDADWNARLPNGEVALATQLSARDIAKQILDQFGETSADVSGMPTSVFPRCKWRGAKAAAALQWLCEYCSVAIGFNLNGQVQLKPYGVGDVFPATYRVHPRWRWSPGTSPKELLAVGGPTRYQSKLKLDPLMVDSDEKTAKEPGGVDYEPTETWEFEPWTNYGNVDSELRWLPATQLDRWLQVISQADGSHAVPGSETEVDHIRQLLPLLPHLIDSFKDESDPPLVWPWKPRITGDFWSQGLLSINVVDQVWSGNFELECETGLVRTEYPIFTVTDQGETPELKLNLTAAYHVRSKTGELDRVKETQSVGGVEGTKTIVRPEVFGAVNVEEDVDTRFGAGVELATYLNWFRLRFEAEALVFECAECIGFEPCPIDGRIQQLSLEWGYGRDPWMRASLGYELDIYNLSFEESVRRSEALLKETGL